MKKNYQAFAIAFTFLALILFSSCQKSNRVTENSSMFVELRKDLNGFKKITDKKTGRNYASGLDSYIYRLQFGNNYKDTIRVTSAMASKCSAIKIKDGIELNYTHAGDIPLNAIFKFWTIKANCSSKNAPPAGCPGVLLLVLLKQG